MRTIISTAVLLSVVYLYLIYSISPQWSSLFGFSDEMHLLKNQFIYLLIGFGIFILFIKLKSSIEFDKMGIFIFSGSIVMLLSMFLLPNSIVPVVDGKKLYIVFGSLHIYPMLFFSLGTLWFINYIHNSQNTKNFSLIIVGLMFLSGFFTLSFHDYGMFLLLEMVLIFLLFYVNGFSKYFVGSIIGVIVTIVAFILAAPHRLSRLQSWLNSSDIVVTQNPLDLGSLSLLVKQFGIVSLLLIMALFLFFVYQIIKKVDFSEKYKLFVVSVAAVITISLGLNLLNVFGFLSVTPPPLYFFDYGLSIIVVSFLMISMLGYSNVKHS